MRKCINDRNKKQEESVYGYGFKKIFSTLFLFYSAAFVKDTDSSINTTKATQKSYEIDIYTNRSKIQSKAGCSVIAETFT